MSPNIQKSNIFLCYQSVEFLANLVVYNSGFKILEKDHYGKCCYCECTHCTQTTQ